jgi:hypothetical protein
VELLVEHFGEPTQTLCPCGHAFIMLLAIFLKPLSWQTLLYQIISFIQNKSQDLSLRQSFYQN